MSNIKPDDFRYTGDHAPEWDWFWELDAYIIGMWHDQPWIHTRSNSKVDLTLGSAVWDTRSFGRGLDVTGGPTEFEVVADHPDGDAWFNWGPGAFGAGPWTILMLVNFEAFAGANKYMNLISTSSSPGDHQAAFIYGFTVGNTEVEFFLFDMSTGDDPRPGSQIDVGSGADPLRQIVYSYSAGNWRGYLDAVPIFDLDKTFTITNEAGDGGFWWGGNNTTNSVAAAIPYGLYINAQLTQGQISQIYDDPYGIINPDSFTIGKSAAVVGTTPKGPLGHTFHGPFAGPIPA